MVQSLPERAITYRGLKTPMLRHILHEFFESTGANRLPGTLQLGHIRYWLAAPMAEDKLTAILWLKAWLRAELKKSDPSESIHATLSLIEDTFAEGDIHDWSTNDWLCVRVLEMTPTAHPAAVSRLMDWAFTPSIWQRRSALLSFKKCGKEGLFQTEIETHLYALAVG